jgi:hypothetical protein
LNTFRLRVCFGFLIAPGAPALAFYSINLIHVSRQEALLGAMILGIPAYVAAMAFGIPGHVFLCRRGSPGLFAYLRLGTLAGLLSYLLIFAIWGMAVYPSAPEHALALLRNSVATGFVAVAYAAIASWLFWTIAIRKRIA